MNFNLILNEKINNIFNIILNDQKNQNTLSENMINELTSALDIADKAVSYTHLTLPTTPYV